MASLEYIMQQGEVMNREAAAGVQCKKKVSMADRAFSKIMAKQRIVREKRSGVGYEAHIYVS